MKDPTRKEIEEALAKFTYISECDTYDREAAIYWFASYWHGGQWSNLYSVLSCSEFHPCPLCNGPEGLLEEMLVEHLEQYFGS